MNRKIKKIIPGNYTKDGAGVHLKRVFGYHEVPLFDPYLMLDFFDSKNPEDYGKGFPWHPHRGIQTITFLSSGEIEHKDSLGNAGIIHHGDCQWMTAGSGIIHQEMPLKSDHMLGIQLWANLPAVSKMMKPDYNEIKSNDIPLVQEQGQLVRIIAGNYKEKEGPMQRKDIDAMFLDVELEQDGKFSIDTTLGHTVFAILVSGSGIFADSSNVIEQAGSAVLYEDGKTITITAGSTGVKFLLISGKPIGEPVAWGGPIVMNSQKELDLAFKEYDEGTFIKKY